MRPALTIPQLEKLRDWLDTRYQAHRRNELVAAAFYGLVAIAAHAFAIGAAAYVEFMLAPLFGAEVRFATWMWLVPAISLAFMYPLYFGRYHDPELTVELNHGRLIVPSRKLDMPEFEVWETPDRHVYRKLKLDVFLFPIWAVAQVVRHLANAAAAGTSDKWAMARALAVLYAENRRVPVHDLDDHVKEKGLAGAIRALESKPGVLFFVHDGGLALSLSDELANKVAVAAGIQHR